MNSHLCDMNSQKGDVLSLEELEPFFVKDYV